MSGSSSTTRMRWLAGLVGTRSFGSARCKVAQPTRAWQFSAHHVRAPGAPRRRATARPPSVAMIRVFVNERPVSVAPGARVRDAVEQLDHELAELHVHLDGCLRPETMLELGRVQGIRLPADTPEGLARALSVKHAKSLEEYLTKYEMTLSVMQTAAALERVAYEFVLDVAADGVRYVEVRYSPLLHRPALTLAQAIEAPLAGIKRGEAETGSKVGVIVCGIRTRPPAESLELARAAVEYRSAGVVGFDLAGAERGFPARDHAGAFAYAAQHDMACTCHAGEG